MEYRKLRDRLSRYRYADTSFYVKETQILVFREIMFLPEICPSGPSTVTIMKSSLIALKNECSAISQGCETMQELLSWIKTMVSNIIYLQSFRLYRFQK